MTPYPCTPFRYGTLLAAVLGMSAALTNPGSAVAQHTGRIEGTVRGPAGVAIHNAQIFVEGTRLSATTGGDGTYVIERVPAGTYALRAQFIGYQPVTRTGIVVEPGKTVTVDFRLAGAVQLEMLTVTAAQGEAGVQRWAREPQTAPYPWQYGPPPTDREEYGHFVENPFLAVAANPLSTFSVDVDRASYGNVRRFVMQQGQLPPVDAVRIEELINYFPYGYEGPTGDDPLAVHAAVAPAPWRPQHRLVRIGLQAERVDLEGLPPSNFVFLLDVSGSMSPPNKLGLVKAAFRLLVEELRPVDRVAIVVYAGAAGLVLPSTPGDEKATILAAIDNLQAGGSTAGGAGIRLAYDIARRHLQPGGNNRVILATDGDFNVGVSSEGGLIRLIEQQRASGVFLTVLGVGRGNLQDAKMEQLADHGNGNYAYLDNILEAKKVFVHELGGTLHTVAKDVKIQIEFNPARVSAYRLIGYENRLLRDEDFDDDAIDAGEIGSGHSVTALYEIIPVGVESDAEVRMPDSLRYQFVTPRPVEAGSPELLFVKVRYKEPDGDESRLMTHPVVDRDARPSSEFQFQMAVAEFGLLLRESEYRGSASAAQVLDLASRSLGQDEHGYR
ncbi:MAG: von Willebrand factor type A domain-containing protein, partial [Gemmatimonadales bacterium]